ncbi:hypothetical protein BJX65DRAFT_188563 [Aspergillus insuetus]
MVRRIMICSQCNFQERQNRDCVCCQTVGTLEARTGGSGLDLNWTFSRQPVPWALRLVVQELLLFQLLILVHSHLTTSPAALDKTGCSLLPATPIRVSPPFWVFAAPVTLLSTIIFIAATCEPSCRDILSLFSSTSRIRNSQDSTARAPVVETPFFIIDSVVWGSLLFLG